MKTKILQWADREFTLDIRIVDCEKNETDGPHYRFDSDNRGNLANPIGYVKAGQRTPEPLDGSESRFVYHTSRSFPGCANSILRSSEYANIIMLTAKPGRVYDCATCDLLFISLPAANVMSPVIGPEITPIRTPVMTISTRRWLFSGSIL